MPGGALEAEETLSGPTSIFVGKKLDEHRGSFILEYPMDKGHVVDGGWDAMESLWEVSISIDKVVYFFFIFIFIVFKSDAIFGSLIGLLLVHALRPVDK